MRFLLRLILFWAICAPIFYLFGLPPLLDKLSEKTVAQTREQCFAHLNAEKLVGAPNSPMTAQQAESYCNCVSNGLKITQADLLDMAQRKQPTLLGIQAQQQANTCNIKLQEMQGLRPAPAAPKNEDPNVIKF